MRILHVTEASAGGVWHAIARSASLLVEQGGHSVDVLYAVRQDTESPDLSEAAFSPHVRFRRIEGSSVLHTLWRLRETLLEIGCQYDVIHVHSSKAGAIARLTLPRTLVSRMVYTAHGLAFSHGQPVATKGLYWMLEQVAASRCPRVVAPGRAEVARWAQVYGVDVRLAPNFVDIRDSSIAKPSECESRTVVHVARIVEGKRPDVFSAATALAAERLRAAGINMRSLWVGDGDRSLLGEHVEVTGWVSSDTVREHLVNADALFFATSGEAAPLGILEAWSAWTPVVGSKVIGVRETVTHGVTGWLAGSAEEAAALLVDIMTNQLPVESVCEAAHEELLRSYGPDSHLDGLEAAYSEWFVRGRALS